MSQGAQAPLELAGTYGEGRQSFGPFHTLGKQKECGFRALDTHIRNQNVHQHYSKKKITY